jgi:hypothetical protein
MRGVKESPSWEHLKAVHKKHQDEWDGGASRDKVADGVNGWHVCWANRRDGWVLCVVEDRNAIANLETLEISVGCSSSCTAGVSNASDGIDILKTQMVVWEKYANRALGLSRVSRNGTAAPSGERTE